MNALRHKAIRLRDALNVQIKTTNDGGPSVWMGAGKALEKHWQVLGVRLISKTRGEKLGLALKRNARPLLIRYFGAPINDHVALYDQFTQFSRKAIRRDAARAAAGVDKGKADVAT
ncbi:hypothetical protein [Propionivibrio sp.]|uniref:hypothetical protein n=1 Tax=Propionivibrio sp. TaxID=2212460 RepID=UPI0039E5D068